MPGDLYILDGDVVRMEPDIRLWADWMENADRVIEMSMGSTPTSRWELTSYFYGLEVPVKSGDLFFFVTQLEEGTTEDTMEVRRQPLLSQTKAEALANHARMLDELRPSIGTASDEDT